MRRCPFLLAGILAGALAASSAQAAVSLTPVGDFVTPISATAPPGDARRLFVVERAGVVKVVRDGTTLATPFLDISPSVEQAGEGGLLSIAFSPDYVSTGLLYLFLTPTDATPGAAPHSPIEVREYRRSASDPERADPDSGRPVLTIPHADASNHYGGQLQFGPDGLLYVSVGDGGGVGDPGEDAENPDSRLGKILRLDPQMSPGSPFTVPESNPYANGPGDDLVWSSGLRNPFRFSFDRATGDLTIGDVGQNTVEEVNFAPASAGGGSGADFGWNDCEGTFAYPVPDSGRAPCARPGAVPPSHSYEQVSGACGGSITGGVVVRDPGLEELAGRYIYGDFCKGFIRSVSLGVPSASGDAPSGVSVAPFSLAAFAEDACGRVYVVELDGPVSLLGDGSPSPCFPQVQPKPILALLPRVRLALAGALRQRALRRRAVLVRVRCSAACSARATGYIRVAGRRGKTSLRAARGRLGAGRTRTLKLALGRRARAVVRSGLGARRKVSVRITVGVRGADGKLVSRRRLLRIVG